MTRDATVPSAPAPSAAPVATPSERGFGEGPPPVALSQAAGATLLRLARAVVAATASDRLRTPDLLEVLPREAPSELSAPAAAFVTLHRDGALRGCMGTLQHDLPLWQVVVIAAVDAAARDPRFVPVTPWEVDSLVIDISVLGPPVPLRDANAFRPGIDGTIVERGGRRGLLLPEVASDQGWGLREMLDATCGKAGLPSDTWRDPRTQVLVFRTARFSERDVLGSGAMDAGAVT